MVMNVDPDVTPFEVHHDVLAERIDDAPFALAVVTATKPDFYKQAPVVEAALDQGLPCFVLHTGQHYDDLLGHGLEEYGISQYVGVDLNVRGSLSEKTAELMLKVDRFSEYLADNFGDTTVLPLVHGDTLAAGVFPQAWMFATNGKVAHNEAGLRAMSPSFEYDSVPDFVDEQWHGDWELNRAEPFPEQYDTFVGSAASLYHFAPTELNRQHLLNEGYPESVGGRRRIPVVGNSVVDAIEMKRDADLEESVFDRYPELERRDDWIRVDIHRRANLLESRFTAIIECVVALVEAGYNVNFVEMTATSHALDRTGLRAELEALDSAQNFLWTGLWKHHAHVYEFFESGQCFAALTDSGSVQEELNHITETACLTARFNTDRPETVFEAGTNLLVPPISGEFMFEMVDHAYRTDDVRTALSSGPELYGSDVGAEIVSFLEARRDYATVEWAHDRLGFDIDAEDTEYR